MSVLAYFSSVKKEGANMLLHITREEHCVCVCVCVCVCAYVCTHACICVHAAVYQVGNYLFCYLFVKNHISSTYDCLMIPQLLLLHSLNLLCIVLGFTFCQTVYPAMFPTIYKCGCDKMWIIIMTVNSN